MKEHESPSKAFFHSLNGCSSHCGIACSGYLRTLFFSTGNKKSFWIFSKSLFSFLE
jgi:hypothetical protein